MAIPDLNIPFAFVPDTLADADQVNANLQFVAKLTGFFFPANYGAVGDGVTNDGPALQAGLDACAANGGGTLLLGPYTYLTNQPLFVHGVDVNIQGQGQGTSVITQGFTSNSTNYALLVAANDCGSCEFTHFSLQGVGNNAVGAVPGPTTISAPAVGYGWGFLNFGGGGNKVEFVTASGFYHSFGGIIFRTSINGQTFSGLSFQNCTANMGGQQMLTQYGFYAQGRAGSAAVGTFSVGGSPTTGDTVGFIFDDGQGNVIDTGTYTLTSADNTKPNTTALDLANFINDSAAVVGPNANWNNAAASGPNIAISIDLPDIPPNTQPTYKAYFTGGVTVSPSVTTQVTGGTMGNSQSFPFSVRDCTTPQAQFNPSGPGSFAATEGVHIDGGVQSWSVEGFGTTGCKYGIRVANVNSGNDRNSSLCSISKFSFDHTRVNAISLENGVDCNVHDGEVIANFGVGSPISNGAISVATTYGGGARIHDNKISNCDSGGILIGANAIVENNRIVAVGKGSMSCINLAGTVPLVGVKIFGNKLGTPSVAAQGLGTQHYAIDLVGPGSLFTSTVSSLTIQGNDCQGRSGPINCGTILTDSQTAAGAAVPTYNTVQANVGLNPLTVSVSGINPPAVPLSGVPLVSAPANPFCCDCLVYIVPAGGATVSAVLFAGPNGTNTVSVGATTPFSILCPANTQILPTYGAGSLTWFWQPI